MHVHIMECDVCGSYILLHDEAFEGLGEAECRCEAVITKENKIGEGNVKTLSEELEAKYQ